MAYNDLSECTLTADERVAEKDRIVLMFMFEENVIGHMQQNEAAFLHKMDKSSFVSIKQLFWLRDLREKYL